MAAALIPVISSIVGALATKSLSGGDSSEGGTTSGGMSTSSPEFLAAINSMMARQKAQDPLFEALTNLGVNLLPRSAYQKYPGRTYGTLSGYKDVVPNTPWEPVENRGETQIPPDWRDPANRRQDNPDPNSSPGDPSYDIETEWPLPSDPDYTWPPTPRKKRPDGSVIRPGDPN